MGRDEHVALELVCIHVGVAWITISIWIAITIIIRITIVKRYIVLIVLIAARCKRVYHVIIISILTLIIASISHIIIVSRKYILGRLLIAVGIWRINPIIHKWRLISALFIRLLYRWFQIYYKRIILIWRCSKNILLHCIRVRVYKILTAVIHLILWILFIFLLFLSIFAALIVLII